MFLAACDEYYRCVIAKTSNTTGLCVAVDVSVSLQILLVSSRQVRSRASECRAYR